MSIWFNKIKKLLVAIFIGGVALAAGLNIEPMTMQEKIDAIPKLVDLGERVAKIDYTDAIGDENIVIFSDHKDYVGFNTITSTFTVTNTLNKKQNINISFTTPANWKVRRFQQLNGLKDRIIPAVNVTLPASATGTEQIITIPQKIEKEPNWGAVVKSFNANETRTFRVSFDMPESGEWDIVAVGEETFGRLDPSGWTFEDKFNSDTKSTVDINGQDGWSGDIAADVTAAGYYEGDQSIIDNKTGWVDPYVSHAVTVTDGVVYAALRNDDTDTGGGWSQIVLKSGSTECVMAGLRASATKDIRYIARGGGQVDIGDYVVNQWYLFKITFDMTADTNRIEVYDVSASSWIADSGSVSNAAAGGDIDTVNWTAYTASVNKAWVDYISGTNPLVTSSAPQPKQDIIELWFQ